jgi:hypothetical protein
MNAAPMRSWVSHDRQPQRYNRMSDFPGGRAAFAIAAISRLDAMVMLRGSGVCEVQAASDVSAGS